MDFDTDFQFVSSVNEYNKDTWNDLTKYIKRKAKSKTDDKIQNALKKVEQQNGKNDGDSDIEIKNENKRNGDSDISLSDDELTHDNIKIKEKKLKKKKNTEEETEQFFDENNVTSYDESATFYQMNLSRPLLKAIGELKYVHPTPIQAATIPVALLGKLFSFLHFL